MNEFEISRPGGDIRCAAVIPDGSRVLIAAHGFGSSGLSCTNSLLMQTLPQRGCGVVSFDFPCHGGSRAGRDALRIETCLDYLAAVEAETLRHCPGAEVFYFGSSFGAYITALYLSRRPHAGKAAFFRSAAVTMPEIILSQPWPGAEEELAQKGWFTLDYPGYVRPLELTAGFLQDLRENDLFRCYQSDARLTMLHGDADETAPYAAAVRFAAQTGARLITVPGGHHSLNEGDQPRQMVEAVCAFVEGREV